jgi:hypothetical protein
MDTAVTQDDLGLILAKHHEAVESAKRAAAERARQDEDIRHECAAPLRKLALPLFGEWSSRLAVEGYPANIEDRLGCRPPNLVFRLAPHGGPDSTLMLLCRPGREVSLRITIAGKDNETVWQKPLDDLSAEDLRSGLARLVAAGLQATISRRSDCGP